MVSFFHSSTTIFVGRVISDIEDYTLSIALIQAPRYRPNNQLPVATPCMAGLDFDAEVLPSKPTAHTLPLPAFAWIGIAVRQLCTYNNSPR